MQSANSKLAIYMGAVGYSWLISEKERNVLSLYGLVKPPVGHWEYQYYLATKRFTR